MAKDFLMQFCGLALTVSQPLAFSFQDKKMLGLAVKSLESIDPSQATDEGQMKTTPTRFGKLLGNTTVTFEKAENSAVNLVGKAKG